MVKNVTTKAEIDALAKNGNIVVIDFYADWCEPCKEMAPEVDRIAEWCKKEKPNVKIVKCNAEEAEELAEAFEVEGFPTFAFYQNGGVVDGFVGAEPEILEKMIRKVTGEEVSDFDDDEEDEDDEELDEEMEGDSEELEEDEGDDEEDEEDLSAMEKGLNEYLESEAFDKAYGLESCQQRAMLGEPPMEALLEDVPADKAAAEKRFQEIIETSLFPIGFDKAPSGKYEEMMNTSMQKALAEMQKKGPKVSAQQVEDEMQSRLVKLHESMSAGQLKECQAVANKKDAKAAAQAFTETLELFTVLTATMEWVDESPERGQVVFTQLNGAMNALLDNFTDDQLGLRGTKSRQFVNAGFEKKTREAAECQENADLTKWGLKGAGLPAKKTRKE